MLDHVLDATSAEGLALLNGLEWLNKLGVSKVAIIRFSQDTYV
jgi:hypothetical protein